MNMKFLLTAIIVVTAAQTAQAANKPNKNAKTPAVIATPKATETRSTSTQPAFSWAGPYVGGSVGYGFGAKTSNTDFTNSNGSRGENIFNDATGVIGGAYGGTNLQLEKFVFGAELNLDAASMKSNKTIPNSNGTATTTTTSIDKIASIRGRFGYSLDQLLIYGFGGLATTDLKLILDPPQGGSHIELSNTHRGFTAGAGLEYAISNQLIGSLEYSYYDFGKAAYTNGTSIDIGLTASAVRAGLAYKF